MAHRHIFRCLSRTTLAVTISQCRHLNRETSASLFAYLVATTRAVLRSNPRAIFTAPLRRTTRKPRRRYLPISWEMRTMMHLNMSAAFTSTPAARLDMDWCVKPAGEARCSLSLHSLAMNPRSTPHSRPLTLVRSAKPLRRQMQMNRARQWTPRSGTYATYMSS